MGRPLFLEGEAGVGKTEIAKVLASALGRKLIRLQCYEGLDTAAAVYEWNYQAQMIEIRLAEAQGVEDRNVLAKDVFDDRFLIRRPLLQALEPDVNGPPVLLIDELDRTDEPFEAYLLEVLSDFQITIPEIGTVKAAEPPIVIVTSNRTREIHDALKRRCLYHWVDYPEAERELEIVRLKAPDAAENLSRQIVAFVQALRERDLYKQPGIAETLDWANALTQLNAVLDAIEAVQVAGIRSESDLYWALHTTLIHTQDMREIFNQAFHIFWRDPRMLERMMAMMLPELTLPPEEPEEQTSRRLAEALLNQENTPVQEPEPDIEIDARETMSAAEVLRTKDFEQMSAAESAEARKALSRLHLKQDKVLTRRTRPSSRGPLIDMRATLRASLRGGDIIPLKRRERRHRPPPLVVLCDISGSMSVYARTFLHFLHALTNDRDRVHTFLFGTRLTHVSRQLRHKDVDEALSSVSKAVEDWDGGTRIGETLRRFNVDWARRVLGQGATVLLVTDGLDRDGAEGLEPEIARLHRASRRLIWLNPLLRFDAFEPKALGIRTMLPHVDEFRPVHNLASLEDLVASLSAPEKKWPTAA
eukprot:g4930.t1